MAEPNQHRDDEGLQAPEKLVDALNLLQKERIFVPPTVDQAVLQGAREHLQRLEQPQSRWKPWLSWAATAACLALAFWLGERFSNPAAAHPWVREDINHDGRVDVLDAFALARRIETGGTLDPRWDINGDGRVDRADVNAIAARAVSLAQAGPEPKRSADLSPFRSGGITIWGTEAEWHLDRRVPPGSAGVSPALFHSFRPTRRRGRQRSQAYRSAIRLKSALPSSV